MADSVSASSWRMVQRIEDVLTSRYREALSLDEIAKSVDRSPGYVSALYRRARGRTITSFITELRVRHAESLLVWDSLSVLEVAAASGFGSVSRFYEAFTEVTGRRPREVRGQRGEFVAPKPPTPMLYALWVDDAPENNIRERRALNAIGFAVDCYVSTRQGLTALAHGGYALVISDVRRTGRSGTGDSAGSARHGSAIDEDTGWAFAEAVRRKYPRIPVLLYCGYDDPARRRRARDVGAAGLFTREAELLDAVRREFREGFPERRKPETDHD